MNLPELVKWIALAVGAIVIWIVLDIFFGEPITKIGFVWKVVVYTILYIIYSIILFKVDWVWLLKDMGKEN